MEILNIDPRTLIVQAGGFFILLIIFKLYLFKPIMGILDARRAEVENEYSDAETQRTAAEELKSQYEQHLKQIEDEMRAKVTEAIKEGQAIREEILSDSREQADRILAKAQEEIMRKKDIAMAELRGQTATLAIEAAGKLIEEQLDSDKHRELIGKFISDLEGVTK